MKGFSMTPEQAEAYNARPKHRQNVPTHPKCKQSITTDIAKPLSGHFERKSKGPNKTELEYSRKLACEFPGALIVFEGLTFRLINGHKYTPDWVVNAGNGIVICAEVKARGKNGFRQASYGRAKLAFDQTRIEWNNYQWRWCEKQGGIWDEKRY